MSKRGPEERRSVIFDRAIQDYDRTRGLPPQAMDAVVQLLGRELTDHQPCLEIGVGTGRMALPLLEQGIRMVGVDLSPSMLAELKRKGSARVPLPVAVADAVRLPFADASFGSGLAVHVLHLIPAWRDALTELTRVIRRPGVLLVDLGGWESSWWKELQDRFRVEAGISPRHVGANEARDVDDHMASLGARVRTLEPVDVVETTTIEERLAWLEAGAFSFTWRVDDVSRREAVARLRRWAEDRYGPLEEQRTVDMRIIYRAYELA
jgi:ubiquinone/menaquinone biosynthesis C-methylase UbiE